MIQIKIDLCLKVVDMLNCLRVEKTKSDPYKETPQQFMNCNKVYGTPTPKNLDALLLKRTT